MTLYTFLTVFLIAWAIAVLVMNWKQQRKVEESQAEIERLHQRIEELMQELKKQKNPPEKSRVLHLVESDEDTTN